MIKTENLTKHYIMGNMVVKALDNVSVHIPRGDFVAIVGPSGSGKSTLMNLIGCLDTPTSGIYRLENIKVNKLNDNRLAEIRNKKIGFIFQGFNLVSKLTALENVELPLIYGSFPRKLRHRLARESLENVGLGDRVTHLPAELSGGQQQRAAIARALVTNPSIIMADEPTGNLDSHSGQEILQLFKKLHTEGNTVILITHDEKIANKANRIIHLLDGHIVDDRGVV
jgi:putative ABC transport system ATP-binding protein